jgi:aryl-alcohol dehydrogenase-like predicted oxidoreductase
VAEAEGLTLLQLAYAWLATRPGVDSILVGPASVAQLDDALDAIERTVSAAACKRIDLLSREWAGSETNYVR